MSLINSLSIVGISVFLFLLAPKVIIDSKVKVINEEVSAPPNEVKRLSWNEVDRKFPNQLIGPEAFTIDAITGDIYTGTAEGMIWKLNRELTTIEPIIRVGEDHPNCGSEHVAHICGRVLGLKLFNSETLIVADSYRGIISINLKTKIKEILVEKDKSEMTKSLKLFNSLDISTNGVIYFTISSLKWSLKDFIYSILEGDNSGRIYSFSMFTKELKILASDLYLPSGLALDPDGKSLIVSEVNKRRLIKLDLSKQSNNIEVIMDKLNGFPANVRGDLRNNYYLAMPMTGIIETLSFLYKYPIINYSIAYLVPKWAILKLIGSDSKIYKFDDHGRIIAIIDGTHPGTDFVTEAYEADSKILLGSLSHPYLDVIKV